MTSEKTRQTAANNEFLTNCKARYNKLVYRVCLDLVNGEGGEAAAREWLLANIERQLPF